MLLSCVVAAVLAHLQELMDEEPYATLTRFQGMYVVVSVLTGGGGGRLGACSQDAWCSLSWPTCRN